MDISDSILKSLNERQREAVTVIDKNLLVLAGAGSGKTQVLVHRIAWYLLTGKASAYQIMAVTFTNKAANEMRARIVSLLQGHLQDKIRSNHMWVGTFHGLAHRFLRRHSEQAGLTHNFRIIDNEDQFRMIRKIMIELNIDPRMYPVKTAQWFINQCKDSMIRAHQVEITDLRTQYWQDIYKHYEDYCDNSLVDFSELLLRTFELFQNKQAVREAYQQQFRHILIDEFQDTNNLQYQWLKLLASDNNTLFAVGDDDQAIYGWRGASSDNMQTFLEELPQTHLIKLEQNYRSTSIILEAANKLISNNKQRLGKSLWTNGDNGTPIDIYTASDEVDEARYIADKIKQLSEENERYQDCAIFYRTSAQSRVIEQELLRAKIPYRVYGGVRFYERAEIKDVLAYVRLAHTEDNPSFERIINHPPRGIGQRSLEIIRDIAQQLNTSLWSASLHAIEQQKLSKGSLNALDNFVQLIKTLKQADDDLGRYMSYTLKVSGVLEYYRNSKNENAVAKCENLEELVNAASSFETDEEGSLLVAFLDHIALESGVSQTDDPNSVHMMTLHVAKGLEFNQVFFTGMEEGLCPHRHSLEDLGDIEEERRLCYVGMTRARKHLTLSYTHLRSLYGEKQHNDMSRFIRELPDQLCYDVRGRYWQPHFDLPKRTEHEQVEHEFEGLSEFSLGQRVLHKTFGDGIIINIEGQGSKMRIQVNFRKAGRKWLVPQYANLRLI